MKDSSRPRRPTAADLKAARAKTVKDVIRPGLDVLFVGLNPGLYSAAIGRHFGRPGNRFWPALNRSGLARRPLTPYDSRGLLESNLGITNIVGRATAAASELSVEELRRGARRIEKKILRYKARQAAFLGLGLYRDAFARPRAQIGLQPETIGGTRLWVFPNPSGLNARFQVQDYARMFSLLKPAAASPRSDAPSRKRRGQKREPGPR